MADAIECELEIPDGIHDAESAIEVLRAWIADGALHVIFDPETFSDDFREWGRLLSEISRHVAQAAAADGEYRDEDVLAAIKNGFDAEIGSSGGLRNGQIHGRTKH